MQAMIALLEMPLIRRIVPVGLALIVAALTVELIRRRRLLEEYALFWLGTSAALIVVATVPDIVIWLQDLLKTNYLTIVIVFGFGLMFVVVLQLAVALSRHANQIRQLSQQSALLEHELREYRARDAKARKESL